MVEGLTVCGLHDSANKNAEAVNCEYCADLGIGLCSGHYKMHTPVELRVFLSFSYSLQF